MGNLTFGIWIGYKKTQDHSNDCDGWPHSTPFDQSNFSVPFRLFGQKVNKVNKQNCRIWDSENPKVIISTGRGHLPHSQCNNWSFAHRFRKSNNQPKFWCQLATSELWFDPVELFLMNDVVFHSQMERFSLSNKTILLKKYP